MMQKLGIVAFVVSVGALANAPAALANETICVGALAGAHDNVVVPAGATCNITGAEIKGNVKVFGALNVFSPTTIRGNRHQFVRLFGANRCSCLAT